VSGQVRGRSVGRALKLHQRAWAIDHGVDHVAWTFDPLVARNAWFNLARLGALPVSYLRNFYGGMHDAINGADESDRLLVRWRLTDPLVSAAARTGEPVTPDTAGAHPVLVAGDDGGPHPTAVVSAPVGTVLVGVPPDVEGLRSTRPALARAWRTALRETLGDLILGGATVAGFHRTDGYVVRLPTETEIQP
jgi:predicted GNAT superfamily acetyltransferase